MNSQSQKQVKVFSVIAAVLALLCIAAIIWILHSLFPKAPPVSLPEDFESMTVIPYGSEDEKTVSREDAELLLDVLRRSKPTRRQSLNDTPAGEEYTTCILHTPEEEISYAKFYLYEKDGKMYMEIPYGGIYLVNDPEYRLLGRQIPGTYPEKGA